MSHFRIWSTISTRSNSLQVRLFQLCSSLIYSVLFLCMWYGSRFEKCFSFGATRWDWFLETREAEWCARKLFQSSKNEKGDSPNILQLCPDMEPECNWFPPYRSPQDSFSYNTSISACGNGIAWTKALQCFSSMCWLIHPDLVAYNAASHATGVAKSWQHSLQLLRSMKRRYFVCILYFLLMSCTVLSNL